MAIVEKPMPVVIPELRLPCRCTTEGCLCPIGTATAVEVQQNPAICDQIATGEDGMCNRCRIHLRRGHR